VAKKKWIFFPPDVSPPGVYPSSDGDEVTAPESAVQWYIDFYRKAKRLRPIECVQTPGDLVFIPSGWWHSVINLEESIAVTQNFVSSQNLEKVLHFLKNKKKQDLYDRMSLKLQQQYSSLWQKMEEKLTPKISAWDQLFM